VAYGMLGSVSEAEDAVQQAWLRLGRSDTEAIIDLRAWLTTVVGRICLDMLRARRNHPVESVGAWLPEPLVQEPGADGAEEQAVIADSVGMALLVVLESLSPAERLAFVLHDVFDMRFDEVGQIIGRTELATRQLASRARRRVRSAPQPDRDQAVQRRAVTAFLAAARNGDFEALLRILAPDAVLRFDLGPGREPLRTPDRRRGGPRARDADGAAVRRIRPAGRRQRSGRTAVRHQGRAHLRAELHPFRRPDRRDRPGGEPSQAAPSGHPALRRTTGP